MNKPLQFFQISSALSGNNASFIEALYEQYLHNPDSVPESWRQQFQALPDHSDNEVPHSQVRQRFIQRANSNNQPSPAKFSQSDRIDQALFSRQTAIAKLINQYRCRGHRIADNNPLTYLSESSETGFELSDYGLSLRDLQTQYDGETLQALITRLQSIYCGSLGTEFMHIVNTQQRRWVMQRLENDLIDFQLSPDRKKETLRLLTAAEGIEKHLHRKFVGQKRFSLEGGESLILILDELIQRSGAQNVKELVIGMAHRGRLNVLINILGKNPATLFGEFEGHTLPDAGLPGHSGDVKYHMGFSSDIETPGGPVHLALAFNPSHLEIIDPVVEGSVRARQDRHEASGSNYVIPVLIHGDAAFAGQGVVMETLNMAQTRAFSTGGTVHIIINNQVGFTTSHKQDIRSTPYCTDISSMMQIPVFHVKGDDPESVLFATQLALDFRMKFKRDVIIDLICYRRHGHNEADEPSVTQPRMYQFIKNYATTRELYAYQLTEEQVIDQGEVETMETDYQRSLEQGSVVLRPILNDLTNAHAARWSHYQDGAWETACETSVPLETIRTLSTDLLRLPADFSLQARVAKIMESRSKMAAGALPIDWGFAENMAYATLLMEGYPVRLIGQDVGRGTFFHRHAVLHNQIDSQSHTPLAHLEGVKAKPQIYDSLLSEAGVLGFEYGYSTTEPDTLVIWEAQFGDFANGAQVVIDQFISSGESKWNRLCGLTLLLPHGYEGQGAEHSSARLERFLQLCAEQNIQVCVPTTPAQIFHLLRRQLKRRFRKPLVALSPKSLLRHKLAVSSLEDFSTGQFQSLIPEVDPLKSKLITRVILCAGKIFYDLLEARREADLSHVAIIRIEQLYPFPAQELTQELKRYTHMKELVWCQEEPQNQGAWHQVKHRFFEATTGQVELVYAGRPVSAAPAVGHFKLHVKQQKIVVKTALYGSEA